MGDGLRASHCPLREGMRVGDARRPDQVGWIAEPTPKERGDAICLHGQDYALRWCLVVWRYGTRCWERRADLLIRGM